MSETASLLERTALAGCLPPYSAAAKEMRRDLRADGVNVTLNNVPLHNREAWTLHEAAKVWSVDYHALLVAANSGLLITFRPLTRRGTKSWRRVTRKAMEEYLGRFEE
ncbi:DNA-binding protein [Bifidobacterium sp. 82T10]|uniref:DNA-binding protein n=1 Tax=Bifidobacterium miconis TaxID=2834435 RepID=A0ABS6WIH9_9BIFI|nr:DNA-binding protein [Bifidobacterium miconis]MBW3093379.1 DNA-binding protein [Bifidobacterium miconis]